ncbi:hypothetical protein ACFWIW_09955, partial [Amycolatopsis sp. NPDC058340]|uniref:hypothetical protein n=1 Tax=Amycolatopsis sp. NPDC058340 TaxID=3346453 RepID=UPI003667FC58
MTRETDLARPPLSGQLPFPGNEPAHRGADRPDGTAVCLNPSPFSGHGAEWSIELVAISRQHSLNGQLTKPTPPSGQLPFPGNEPA